MITRQPNDRALRRICEARFSLIGRRVGEERRSFFAFFILVALSFALPAIAEQPKAASSDIHSACKRLGRGINLGNALDAPKEGEWGVTLRAEYFKAIAEAGFATVRLPVRWSAHAGADAPYLLDERFAARVDWAIEQATTNRLNVIVNVHHYGEMDAAPDDHLPRLLAIWKQISQRYQNRDTNLYFELFNEPHAEFDDDHWNAAIPQLLAVVRKANPTRPVIVGPTSWNAISALDKLQLPRDDKHLILTFHYYDPFEFTHQGAPWANGSQAWRGRKWTGSEAEQAAIRTAFEKAAAWAKDHNVPVLLGEFGTFQEADMDSRTRWTRFIARESERQGFSWCYWELCAGFGAYDPTTDQWRDSLKKALLH